MDMNPQRRKLFCHLIESYGLMTVSIMPFSYVKICISRGVLNAAMIESWEHPSRFIIRYRSVCLIERFMMPSTSSCVSDREKGAFFLRLSSLKKDFCCACICSLTASSAYLCIRESMVV